MPSKEGLSEIPNARMQFRIEPAKIPWIYSTLKNQPQVELYSGDFPEPFEKLTYTLGHNQNQLALVAALQVGDKFKAKHKETVGLTEDLGPLLRHYPQHKLFPDGTQLAIFNKENHVQGIIAKKEDQIIIQRGGGVGQLALNPEDSNPINNLCCFGQF